MTLTEADTTPAAMTAALLHEAGRHYDFIQVGSARSSWDMISSEQKDAAIGHVLASRSKSFPEYYEALTTAHRMARRPVPDANDDQHDLVRFARMRYSIIQCLLGQSGDGQ